MIRLLTKIAVVAVASVGLVGCIAAEDDQRWGASSLADTETGDPDAPDAACPVGVTCVDSLPFTDVSTTSDSGAVFDGYSCAPSTNESGAEQVYRVDLATEGLLVASLDGLGAGVDVDIHILETLNDGTCIDRGDWDAAALVQPGRYWIVVDSWGDGSGTTHEGSYELTIALTTAADHHSTGLHPTVLGAGLRAFSVGWEQGDTEELEYGIIDYGMPSTEPRFFVLDLRQGELLRAELVAHGEGSQYPNDMTLTGSLSNVNDSHKSSVGLVRAAETYWGSNGYSMRLDGLEPGFNDNDRTRAIVVHKADYATQSYIDNHGYLGRSWGCPAIDPGIYKPLIDTLAGGRLLLKYFDDPNWLASSSYLAL
jgi:hypothetical protein